MKKIKIFLASSKELQSEREHFEREIYRKCKIWFDRGIFLHLDIWEDLSTRMSLAGSQNEYNQYVKAADLFVLLVHSKVGMYSAEEFDTAFGQFQSTKKPFIFTYFKTPNRVMTDTSIAEFHQKLKYLNHFYSPFKDENDLWVQFNKELDRLETDEFTEFKREDMNPAGRTITQGDKSIYIEKADDGTTINIQ